MMCERGNALMRLPYRYVDGDGGGMGVDFEMVILVGMVRRGDRVCDGVSRVVVMGW